MEDFPAAIKLYTILVDNTEKVLVLSICYYINIINMLAMQDNPNYSDLIANLIAAKAAALVSGTKLSQKVVDYHIVNKYNINIIYYVYISYYK
jgi:hypothetical protein